MPNVTEPFLDHVIHLGFRIEPPRIEAQAERLQQNVPIALPSGQFNCFGRQAQLRQALLKFIAGDQLLFHDSDLRTLLPKVEHETIPDFLLVLRISRQIRCEKSFFVKETPYQKRNHSSNNEKTPVRAQYQRRAKQVE